MFLHMLEIANFFITEYEIFTFPVSLDTIDQIIDDMNIKLIIKKNLKSTLYMDGELITGVKSRIRYREDLSHEMCHIRCHSMNKFNSNKVQIVKNEAQAQAFAAYFLMPVFIFEQDLSDGCSDYELSENFGVCMNFIKYRKILTESLINIDYFNLNCEEDIIK